MRTLLGRMPAAVLDGESLTMSFYGHAHGITYRVETSTDLRGWTEDGVALSEPGPDGMRQALVARDAPRRFLCLVVE